MAAASSSNSPTTPSLAPPSLPLSSCDPVLIERIPSAECPYRIKQGSYQTELKGKQLLELFQLINDDPKICEQLALVNNAGLLMTRAVCRVHCDKTFKEMTRQHSDFRVSHPEFISDVLKTLLSIDYNIYLSKREERLITDEDDAMQRLEKNCQKAQTDQEQQKSSPSFDKAVAYYKNGSMDKFREEEHFETQSGRSGNYEWGIAARKNRKGSGERPRQDAHLVTTFKCVVGGHEQEILLAAVFDGHGSKGELLSQHLIDSIVNELQKLLPIHCGSKLSACGMINTGNQLFRNLENSFLYLNPSARSAGSTATVTLVIGDLGTLNFNVGDSRSLVISGDQLLQLNAEHQLKPDKDWGILRRGGSIGRKGSGHCYRANKSGPNMGRAIGDTLTRGVTGFSCISCRAKTTWYPGQLEENALIVAFSDGVGDKATTEQIGRALKDANDGMLSLAGHASIISLAAKRAGNKDDITTVIVRHCGGGDRGAEGL